MGSTTTTKSNPPENKKCLWKCGEIGTLTDWKWECKRVQPLWKIVWHKKKWSTATCYINEPCKYIKSPWIMYFKMVNYVIWILPQKKPTNIPDSRIHWVVIKLISCINISILNTFEQTQGSFKGKWPLFTMWLYCNLKLCLYFDSTVSIYTHLDLLSVFILLFKSIWIGF